MSFFRFLTKRMDENKQLHYPKLLIRLNQSAHLTKERCARIISSHVIVNALTVNNICCLKRWVGTDVAF